MKPDSVTFVLKDSKLSNDPKLVLVVKDIENDDPYAGSVSIPRSICLGSGMDEEVKLNHAYPMWITLFDDQNDDEYDGALGV